ncbi:hypothetical protein SEVIR_3G275100v4 [Setaria viridis]|uniref:PHD finger protein ALFIN-LIKE n=1 Tax=Setaria viridis TaxID=4556 RepID=A0A4U6VDY9_SETVI|nr:hypothetical protein SEVIR_3G275100v2 [Setaria viridis]
MMRWKNGALFPWELRQQKEIQHRLTQHSFLWHFRASASALLPLSISLASSPRSPLPAQPLHGQATGTPAGPPPPLPASSRCSPLPAQTPLRSQATAAPMETPPAAAPAPLPPPARPSTPSYTVECIFRDFTCRRAALIRALTTDEKAFSRTESLYLYGNSDGNWELRPPKLLMPPGQPDPRMFGIKLVRGNMKHPKWLAYIATHCDAWLIRISFFLGANLGTQARQHLSALINSLQTVHEAFVASDTYHRICHLEKMNVEIEDEDEGCGTEPTVCASCGNHYRRNGFWICCDECDRWFHGKCVKVTAALAEHIGHYECPECCSDKKGHDYNVDPLLSVLYKRY